MQSDTASGLRQEIIRLCEGHERSHESEEDYRRCVVFEGFFVKFGNYKSLYPEYKTQEYLSKLAASDASAPHVPHVCDFFTPDDGMAYLVMEYIEPTHSPVPDLPQRAAQALQWLRGLRLPDDAQIGCLGGGRARHRFFKDYTAPLSFSSIEALERYMNMALLWIPPKSRPDPVSISHESLVFVQSDVDMSNFFVDTQGNTCLVDCEDVAILPESFASYTMSLARQPFAVEVARYLGWPRSSNVSSMARIRGILWKMGDPTLGLDDDGLPVSPS